MSIHKTVTILAYKLRDGMVMRHQGKNVRINQVIAVGGGVVDVITMDRLLIVFNVADKVEVWK